MKMRKSAWAVCWIMAGLACFGPKYATGQVVSSSASRLIPFEDALKSRGINTDPASLISALTSIDPVVRSMAANKLAEDRVAAAIPQMEAALSTEKDPQTRIGIAGALSVLNDPIGIESLQAMCTDPKLPTRFIIESASHLQIIRLPSGVCAETILSSLRIEGDAPYRASAVSILSAMYREVPPEQANRILSAIETLPKDRAQQLNVRLLASHALVQIGAPSSIEALRVAVTGEWDATMKSALQADLDTLQKKQ
jgi:HEAT repeat protein